MIEMTDRYEALGIELPPPGTCCKGRCEGTGYVPVKADHPDERFRKLWQEAQAKEPTDDGYHFVKCPDCNGTGRIAND
jgi:hypothetical protein